MPKSIFSQDEIEFIQDNYSNMDTNEIAEILGKKRSQVKGKADTLGLRKGIILNPFTPEDELYLTQNYPIKETSFIAKKLNRTVKQINDKACNMGLSKNLEPLIEYNGFFKEIDSEDKAYWLGFIYADGCVVERCNKERTRLKSMYLEIGLSALDKSHLEKFAKIINFKGDLKHKVARLNGKEYEVSKLAVYNTEMCRDLIKLNCNPRKSLKLQFPSEEIVPKGLVHHFLRGYFDGDGCVFYRHDNNGYIINFVGTKNLLDGIQDEFVSFGAFKTAIRKKGNAYQVSWSGYTNFSKIYNYLYKDSNIYLDRKKIKFEKAFNTKKYIRNVAYYHRNMASVIGENR